MQRPRIFQMKKVELNALFEDEHILAVVKPAGIATHPDGPTDTGTLMNRVMAYVRKSGGDYAEHIHRLDKGTSGVVLIAKHPIAKSLFDRMIEHNDITRKYTAEVDGYLKRPRGTIKTSNWKGPPSSVETDCFNVWTSRRHPFPSN